MGREGGELTVEGRVSSSESLITDRATTPSEIAHCVEVAAHFEPVHVSTAFEVVTSAWARSIRKKKGINKINH